MGKDERIQQIEELSASRRRLMACLIDPALYAAPISKICEQADVNPSTYYIAMKDSAFAQLCASWRHDIMAAHAHDVARAITRDAMEPGNAAAKRLYAEIMGWVGTRQEDVTGDRTFIVQIGEGPGGIRVDRSNGRPKLVNGNGDDPPVQ